MDFDFIDTDIIYAPAYWILVALAFVGLAIGFGGGNLLGGATGSEYQIPFLIKAVLLIAVFPIAYVIVKIISK